MSNILFIRIHIIHICYPRGARRLRYFLAVAEELSFTRAAAQIQMAKPPLSAQIQVLESELGAQLFDRSRRAITLTAAGRALVPKARRLLADAGRRPASSGTPPTARSAA